MTHTRLTAAVTTLIIITLASARSSALETDIFLSGNRVSPNVLLLFDNSGSMNYQPKYDPNQVYPGSFDPATVYHRCNSYRSDCTCSSTTSTWTAYSGSCGFADGDNDGVDDRTTAKEIGNRRNYETGTPDKLTTAKAVITKLLNDPANGNVRFGLMTYNGDWDVNQHNLYDPGNFNSWHNDPTILLSPIQDSNHGNLISIVNQLTATGGTPSANRMIAAANYFAGSFPGYSSPIQFECQRNYIVNITDGIPEGEGNDLFANSAGDYDYVESWLQAKLGADLDPDNDGADPDPNDIYIHGGSDYMDDVAWTLFNQDVTSALQGTQNIVTYTIGFDITHPLLESTAINGGGRYFTATTADELADALRRTLNLIITDAQSFVAPVVPVSALKRTQSGDRLYLALFQPIQGSAFWAGNIKKYGVAGNGDLISPDGSPVTNPDGSLVSTASSYWDTSPSGGKVTRGGVGEVLADRIAPRLIYTYRGNPDLTATSNAFTADNANITAAMLGVADDTARNEVISYVRGQDAFDDDADGDFKETRQWILGDFIHSSPLIVTYGSGNRLVIAGANDGQLHAFDDQTGEELWAFVPPAVLPRLKELTPGVAAGHPFLVDGSAKLLITDGGRKVVVFGLRRGSANYYALDVSSKNSPQLLWSLGSDTPGMSELGQAWSEPALGKMGDQTSFTYVAIFGAGYDPHFDDPASNNPNPTNPVGRGVYIVNALTGSLMHALQPGGMDYPVPSNLAALDLTGDDTFDIAYTGDLGGNLWRLELPSTMTKVFSSPGRRIFFAPDLVRDHGFIDVFFGTGDLANPLEMATTNRLYMFRDDGLTGTYTEANLVDITDNVAQEGSQAQRDLIKSELAGSRGWFLRLLRQGEKALASPLAFFDVFFTTFTPTADACAGGGEARLYILGFDDGTATLDRNGDGVIDQGDRASQIGTSIPTELAPTIREDAAFGYAGVGGGVPKIRLTAPPLNVVPLYWREVY